MAWIPFKAGLSSQTGFAIGAKGSEVEVIDSGGNWTGAAISLTGVTETITLGAQASVSGSGIALSASRTAALAAFGDDAGAAIASSVFVRPIRGRMLLTYTAGNREQEAAGIVGQLVSVAGTNRHNMCGVMGSYEGSGAFTVDGQAWATDPWIQAAVIGRVGVGSGITTVNSNGVLAGLAAVSNTTSFLSNSGYYTGLFIGKWSGTTDWGYGITIDPGAVGVGFYIPGGTATSAMLIGDFVAGGASGSAVPITAALDYYSDGQLDVVGFYGESTSNLTSAYSSKVARFRHIATGSAITVAQETYGAVGQMVVKGSTLTHLHAGLMGTFEGHTSGVVLNSSYAVGHAGVLSRIGGGGAITATTPIAGFLAFWNGAALASGNSAAFATAHLTTAWTYGLYIPASSVTTDISLQSGSTIVDSNHLDIETLSDTKRVRLNDRTYAATSGDIIAFSAKPAANASGTQTVYGGQISPRVNDNIDIAAIVGLQVEPILKGATAAAVSGDMRGLDVRLSDDGNSGHTVGGVAAAIDIYNNLKSSTFTGGVYPINVRANGDTQAWTGLMNIPAVLTNAADCGGAAVYLNISIDGVAARITAKYVS